MSFQEKLYEFLRHGDDHTKPPEQYGLRMDLGMREHQYLAEVISAWAERHYEIREKEKK